MSVLVMANAMMQRRETDIVTAAEIMTDLRVNDANLDTSARIVKVSTVCKMRELWFLLWLDVMYSGENEVCFVTLTLNPHRTSRKIYPTLVGIEPTNTPEVLGLISIVIRGQVYYWAYPLGIYTQINTANIKIWIIFSRGGEISFSFASLTHCRW